MSLDYERYRKHLTHFNLSKQQEDEVIEAIWQLVSSSIDQAFGVHPIQLSRGYIEPAHLQSHNKGSDSTSAALKSSFTRIT